MAAQRKLAGRAAPSSVVRAKPAAASAASPRRAHRAHSAIAPQNRPAARAMAAMPAKRGPIQAFEACSQSRAGLGRDPHAVFVFYLVEFDKYLE